MPGIASWGRPVDPRAWFADVLARIADHAARRIAELLPWNWKAQFGQSGMLPLDPCAC